MLKMEQVLSNIISANEDINTDKLFSELYFLDEVKDAQQMLDILDVVTFKNKEFRTKFVDMIQGLSLIHI